MDFVKMWDPSTDLNPQKCNPLSSRSPRSILGYKPASQYNSPARVFKRPASYYSEMARIRDGGFLAGAQGVAATNLETTNIENKTDDEDEDEEFPSLRRLLVSYPPALPLLREPTLDICGSLLSLVQPRSDNGTNNSQGQKDRPVLHEDGEADTLVAGASTISISVDAIVNSAPDLSKPVDKPGDEEYWDINNDCSIGEDCQVLCDLDVERHDVDLEEVHPQAIPEADPGHHKIDSEHDRCESNHSRSGELENSSPTQTPKPQKEVRDEITTKAIEDEEKDADDYEHEGHQRGKRQHRNETEIDHFKANEHSHDTNDETDEDARPPKRRKRLLMSTKVPLKPPREQSLESCLDGQCRGHTPSSEIEDIRAQSNHERLPTPTDNEERSISQTSQNSPAAIQATSAAEYREWPFQGFLKRTKIGSEVTYNLEFQLPCISDGLKLPIDPDMLHINSTGQASTKTGAQDTIAHSKFCTATVPSQSKRAAWTADEEDTVIQMKKNGSSWEKIGAALPHRTIGTIQVRYSTKLKPRASLSITSDDESP